MKLRPVLLVLLILCGFYFLTTRWLPAGAMAGLMHHNPNNLAVTTTNTPNGNFTLTEASAAPAYDTEEVQNIAVYKKALPSVVNITSTEVVCCDFFLRPVPQQGQGSGFIIDNEGHILTNYHVVADAENVEVTLWNKKKFKATRIGVDPIHDVALLQITGAKDLQPATLADSTHLLVGQQVYAIGNPFGFSGTMTRGMISDASVNPGNSGGPLLNSHGDVVGITTMIASNPNGGADQSAGIGFAIPISTAKAVVEDIMKYGHARRPSLDIVTLPIGPDEAEQIGLPADYGILIERVLPGGAAAQAGLHGGNQLAYKGRTQVMLGGDLIVKCDGQEITSPQDLSNALNEHRAGDTVVLTIYRGQQRMSVKVTLSDAKQASGGQEA